MKRTPPHLQQANNLLTKSEAAAYLGIAPRTIDDWRKARALACIERPGYVRFLRADLDSFLERHRRHAKGPAQYRSRAKRDA